MKMSDQEYMRQALREAEKALLLGEVPIGAVVVQAGQVIVRTHNLKEARNDATAHAEILAIQEASSLLTKWRLNDCTLYVTLEPCPMCAGALVQCRMQRVVYGAYDWKAGAAGSLFNLLDEPRLNHQVFLTSGVLAEECQEIMQRFFADLRQKRK